MTAPEAKQFVVGLAKRPNSEDPKPPYLDPEYAIGQGLISRDEFNSLFDQYYVQSTLALGSIVPLLVLVGAMIYKLHIAWWWLIVAIVVDAAAFYVGMDRMHKFESEVQTLIQSRFDKAHAAKPEQSKPTPDPNASPAIAAALKELRQEIKDLRDVVARMPNVTIYNEPKPEPQPKTPQPSQPIENEPAWPNEDEIRAMIADFVRRYKEERGQSS